MGIVTVTALSGFEVGVGVVILDGVLVLVLGRDIGVGGFLVVGGGGTVGGGVVSNSNAGDKGDKGKLERWDGKVRTWFGKRLWV